MGFEPMAPVIEGVKTVPALHNTTAVVGLRAIMDEYFKLDALNVLLGYIANVRTQYVRRTFVSRLKVKSKVIPVKRPWRSIVCFL
jgi:hypothetical protein